ncbi:MAG: DUF333 domain-containing protein [Candidatus Paceibacterota bacterium]
MNKTSWIVLVVILGLGVFGAYWYENEIKGSPTPWSSSTNTPSGTSESTGIANPASTNCITLGGSLEIVESADGQIGLCHLKDGRVCEEWALFRDGTCKTQ